MENNDNILENVARIAADHMATLVDKLHEKMDSRAIIFEYIVPWAKEAEAEYQRTRKKRESEGDYLDWLDAFSAQQNVEVVISLSADQSAADERIKEHLI